MNHVTANEAGYASQLAAFDVLKRAEQQALVSHLASIIGHIIGTPLNVIAGRAALIREDPANRGAVTDGARRIEQQVEQLAHRVQRLIDLLSPAEGSPDYGSVEVLLEELGAFYVPIAHARGAALAIDPVDGLEISIDAGPAKLVLASLLSMATSEVEAGSALGLRVTSTTLASRSPETRAIRFDLTMPGIALPRGREIERFESADPKHGSRLYVLALAARLTQRAGGMLEVQEGDRGETTVRVTWPSRN